MASSPRSGLIRSIALLLLLAGGVLSSVEFALHCANSRAEAVWHVEANGGCASTHQCLGTAMSDAGITPAFDARKMAVLPDGLLAPVEAPASRLAFTPSPQPTSRAPPPIRV